MKNALILHGTGATSQDNWFQWMKEKLQEKGYKVWAPDLPNSMYPNSKVSTRYILDNWKFDKDSIVVGHSSGAVLILFLLRVFGSGDDKLRFAVVSVGLVVSLILGYLKFISPSKK